MAIRFVLIMLVSSFISIASGQTKPTSEQCVEQKKLLDSAVGNITMVINSDVVEYPDIEDFDDKYCKPFLSWYRVLSGFKPCLKSFTRTLFAFVGTNMKKLHKEFCAIEDKKVLAFNHLKCMNPKSKPEFMKVGKMTNNFVSFIQELPDENDIIPSFCCGYLNVSASSTEQFEASCQTQGRSGSGVFMGNIVKSLLSDAIDMMCGAYSKPADCQTPKMKSLMAAMAERLRSTTVYPYKSIMPPVLEIFKRMDGKMNVN